jgi:CMD domain protein
MPGMDTPGVDTDVIDTLAGIKPGSALDAIRNRRPDARNQAQASYHALFAPEDFGEVTATERFAVAAVVTGLHGGVETASFYAAGLAASGTSPDFCRAFDTAIATAKGQGPYGSYPPGPLSREDTAGPIHHVAADTRHALGSRLAAAFDQYAPAGVPPA